MSVEIELVNNYIDILAKKYKIDVVELNTLWTQQLESIPPTKVDIITAPVINSDVDYNKMTKNDLIKLCKERKLKCSGKKEDLIGFLVSNTLSTKSKSPSTTAKEAKLTSTQSIQSIQSIQSKLTKISSIPPTIPTILQSICSKKTAIKINRNQFGNFEHQETGFIFNNKTQKVIGKQNKNGDIDNLDVDDIDLCNKYKFSYVMPTNLDSKQSLVDVNIDDLDDDVTTNNDTTDLNDLVDEDLVEEEEEFEEEEYEEEYDD